ncbi:hypothetical protein C7M84_012374 [Penaeus vannamei]|uniref:Uncharacterized protein n=1 Tax=Penaeus vannamei TaxID=6689 RepID=A0A423SYP1_PENVA|nr:hypothetical protein C7M84_012374 [Penaeus vannamei]
MLKGEKLSFELIRQEKELAEQMQKRAEEQLMELQRKIPREYVPKATLLHLQAEIESKCQLELSNKLAELNQLIDQQSQQQQSQAKVKESQEQGLRNEISRLSEEIIRLRAKLSVYSEEEDTWKTRHNRLMDLYQHEVQTKHNHIHKNTQLNKPKEESVSINLREINAHLQTPFASSTFLGQLTPPSSLHLPKAPSNIDSYHYTHSDTLDRTLNKYLSSVDERPRSVRIDDKPQTRTSHVQPPPTLWRKEQVPTLDQSCEDYVDLLRKKYGL